MMNYNIYSPYFLCFSISILISFVDILDNYSIYRIKVGLKYKIAFPLLNGLVSSLILLVLWNSSVLQSMEPSLKGLYVGIAYPVLMKSKVIYFDKEYPYNHPTPEKLYRKVLDFFKNFIDAETQYYITDTKNKLANTYTLDELFAIAKDAIEDNPHLEKNENKKIKNDYLEGINKFKNDEKALYIDNCKSIAKFLIDKFPGIEKRLIYMNPECEEHNREYITDTKNRLANKYTLDELFVIAKDAIEDDPYLEKDENNDLKKEYLEAINKYKDYYKSHDIDKRKSIAKFLINNFPGIEKRLL